MNPSAAGPEPASAAPPVRSIHYRRRWAYALWVVLLFLSLGALLLWERPAEVGTGSYQLKVAIRKPPPGAAVELWIGPWARWAGPGRFTASAGPAPLQADGSASLPAIRLPIARRRWVRDYIPRGTWDLVVVRFTAPGEAARYMVIPLSTDLRTGLLGPHRRLTGFLNCSWAGLYPEPQVPKQKP
jgi:hypothetical protein